MKKWCEDKQDNLGIYDKYSVINIFSEKSNNSTKSQVNQIIRKLCENDLETICSLEYDDDLSFNYARSINERSVNYDR